MKKGSLRVSGSGYGLLEGNPKTLNPKPKTLNLRRLVLCRNPYSLGLKIYNAIHDFRGWGSGCGVLGGNLKRNMYKPTLNPKLESLNSRP